MHTTQAGIEFLLFSCISKYTRLVKRFQVQLLLEMGFKLIGLMAFVALVVCNPCRRWIRNKFMDARLS